MTHREKLLHHDSSSARPARRPTSDDDMLDDFDRMTADLPLYEVVRYER